MYRNKDEGEARSRTVFVENGPMSLQELRRRVDTGEGGIRRRDMLSALDSVPRLFGRELATMSASARLIRLLVSSKTATELGISEKRYANIKSGLTSALRRHGEEPAPITKRIPFTPEWSALLGKIDERRYRCGLYRLAAFCSHMRTAPSEVNEKTLLGLFHALEAEEVIKHPRCC